MLYSLQKDHRGEPRVVAFGVEGGTTPSTLFIGMLFVREQQKRKEIVMRDFETKVHYKITLPPECLKANLAGYMVNVSVDMEKRDE
jgi:hypothetical protein